MTTTVAGVDALNCVIQLTVDAGSEVLSVNITHTPRYPLTRSLPALLQYSVGNLCRLRPIPAPDTDLEIN